MFFLVFLHHGREKRGVRLLKHNHVESLFSGGSFVISIGLLPLILEDQFFKHKHLLRRKVLPKSVVHEFDFIQPVDIGVGVKVHVVAQMRLSKHI